MNRLLQIGLPSAVLAIGLTMSACTSKPEAPAAVEESAAPAIPVMAEPPVIGAEAPAFRLVSNEGTDVDLASYRGQWVVLYFYPKDFTGGCTIQARNFQRDMAQYESKTAVVLGVSFDDAKTHAEFCEKEGLSFKLLADTQGVVSAQYGSVRGEGDSRLSARNTFLIDPDGKVAQVYLGVEVNAHSEAVLADLARLQAG
jgi:peroxiredoxin Q/BCP